MSGLLPQTNCKYENRRCVLSLCSGDMSVLVICPWGDSRPWRLPCTYRFTCTCTSVCYKLYTIYSITFQLYIRGMLISWVRANHEIHEIKTPRIFCRFTVMCSHSCDCAAQLRYCAGHETALYIHIDIHVEPFRVYPLP